MHMGYSVKEWRYFLSKCFCLNNIFCQQLAVENISISLMSVIYILTRVSSSMSSTLKMKDYSFSNNLTESNFVYRIHLAVKMYQEPAVKEIIIFKENSLCSY